jgi:hypothetical protein
MDVTPIGVAEFTIKRVRIPMVSRFVRAILSLWITRVTKHSDIPANSCLKRYFPGRLSREATKQAQFGAIQF